MRIALLSLLAFAACASVACAEPLPPADRAKDTATAEAHTAGPVALTEAEMDKVTAGGVPTGRMYFNYVDFDNANTRGNCHRCGSYYIQSVVHQTNG